MKNLGTFQFARRLPQSIIANADVRHAASVVIFYALLFTLFFSPVLFTDHLLAPGDGISYFVPNFYAESAFWDASIWSGYPSIADLQGMFWYPPARLFALLLPPEWSWNLFVVSAYVLAACFTYGYVYTLTKSRLAGFASGLIYGLSGCLVAHLGHAVIIHSAAWFPLNLWTLEKLRRADSARWFLVGSFSIMCGVLSGHPQIFLYTVTVTAAYALVTGWTLPAAAQRRRLRWRYYGRCLMLLIFGIGMAAIQLVPTAELARESVRASLDFTEFVAYALPLKQLPTLLFPFLFGGTPDSLYDRAYFGEWGGSLGAWASAELVGYVGLLTLMLASIGVARGSVERSDVNRSDDRSDVERSESDRTDIDRYQKIVPRFWLIVGVLALLLALGGVTPLAEVTYRLPLFNKFRAPARHLLEMTFALSVLAGFGIRAVSRGRATRRFVNRVVAAHVGLVLGCWLLLLSYTAELQALAGGGGGRVSTQPLSLVPWANSALGVPMLMLTAGGGALLYWQRDARSIPRSALLLVVLALDLASFGWFYEWRRDAPPTELLHAPAGARRYQRLLKDSHQRVLPVRGGAGKITELPPNLSKLWEVPSASGYGPFVLARIHRLLGMTPHGSIDDTSWRDPFDQSIDLLAVRYLLLPASGAGQPAPLIDQDGFKWSTNESGLTLGQECNQSNAESITIDVPDSAPAAAVTTVGITGLLACASAVPDQAEVVRVEVTDTTNTTSEYSLRAGSDLSEWAYDCSDVRPHVQHRRAQIFKSFAVERSPLRRCDGHEYVTKLKLNEAARLKRIKLQWTGPATAGAASIKRISLINENTRLSYPIDFVDQLAEASRWRRIDTFNRENSGYQTFHHEGIGSTGVFENLRALPRAWLVGETLTMTNEEALLRAIKSSRLPDNRFFDVKRTALVEVPLKFKAEGTIEPATAQVVQAGKRDMEVRTSSRSAGFLVTSDVYYPGWRASVDGKRVDLLRANYVLRGVVVPAGRHVVRFEWQPQSFIYGAATSVASILALLVLAWRLHRQAQIERISVNNMPPANGTSTQTN